mmetsp:Transcript_4614/g.8639  ORF Transcript_4614/g.8639 Transcript_4614/m.8639 type:complete len:393 (+) Transcript_4614:92-1270(+)
MATPTVTNQPSAEAQLNKNSACGEHWAMSQSKSPLVTAVSRHIVPSNHPCEDMLVEVADLGDDLGGLFAVIDGHGGTAVAAATQRLLPLEFAQRRRQGAPPGEALPMALEAVEQAVLAQSVTDRKIFSSGACIVACYVAAHRPEEDARDEDAHQALHAPLLVANIGDSRAVMGALFEGEVLPYDMSKRHNTSNSVEVLRLQALHKFPDVVSNAADPEDPRVMGVCQVTRSLGDAYLKGVTFVEPETDPTPGNGAPETHRRKKKKPDKFSGEKTEAISVISAEPYLDSMTDELRNDNYAPACFLVLASDGLFDHLSEGEVCAMIDNHVKGGSPRESAAEALSRAAIKRAAFKQNELSCTSKWLEQFPPGRSDEWDRTRREMLDDISIIILFFR